MILDLWPVRHWLHFWQLRTTISSFIVTLELRVKGTAFAILAMFGIKSSSKKSLYLPTNHFQFHIGSLHFCSIILSLKAVPGSRHSWQPDCHRYFRSWQGICEKLKSTQSDENWEYCQGQDSKFSLISSQDVFKYLNISRSLCWM